ncbi:coxsackievirus and adenovirus receptor-like [Perca fluviatilis]|uniref:coxsackievirus and adenovirus receptor-like n=1 Tax=Perca fluviatilis TaxID=8168 RepID=UPI001964BE3C|nr:coxsackievirus and adenovirus receptor-like [Perca fluviatilis]
MALLMLLLFLLPAAASDQEALTVYPGDDVTLPCQTDYYPIGVVQWSRPDLKQEYVLLYRDGHMDLYGQHPELYGRVDLVDRELKDGDVSLILKNVRGIDRGTYKCRVKADRSRLIVDSEPIRTIHLLVTEPGFVVRNSSPVGRDLGLAAGGLLLVSVAVVGVLIY